MFQKLDAILLGNQFAGIEFFTTNSEERIVFVQVEKKKGELSITTDEAFESIELLLKKFDSKIPTSIVINNSNVVQKEVDYNDRNESKVLNKAFPNIKHDEFYYEIFTCDSKSIVSICRKNYVDDLLANLKLKGIICSSVSIGSSSLSQVKQFTNELILQTNINLLDVTSDENYLQNRKNENVVEYNINGLNVKNTCLLGFSSILQFVLKNTINSGNINELNEQLIYNFNQENLFKKTIRFTVFSLLFILLINFFIFNNYYEKVNRLSLELAANKSSVQNINDIKERLKLKNEKLRSAVFQNDSKSSWHINEIIKLVPSSIQLSELTYNPLLKKIKEDEALLTQNNEILISGKTISSIDFTNWVNAIEKNKNIENVTILNFGKNELQETVFSIKIKVHETQ